jgi:hypothetical protein
MTQSSVKKINLACGDVFVSGDGWINLDYASSDASVMRADLLGRLPVADDQAALVYSSHFLEHIPRDQVEDFLLECFRILSPDGVLRLVLPDLDNMCRTYLAHRDAGEHDKANFLVLEMIDQCVRRESGGELGRYYQQVKSELPASEETVALIRERTGENLHETPPRRSMTLSGGGATSACWQGLEPSPAPLDTRGVATLAGSFPCAEHQLGGGGREASLALGSRTAAASFGERWLRRCPALPGINQPLCRLLVPCVGSRRRRSAAQGGRVDVYRGAQTRVTMSRHTDFHCGGLYD